MLAPLARMLVAHGVTYPQIAQALKSVFLEAARAELEGAGKSLTDSALSLLSGVHRKDVRALAGKKTRVSANAARDLSFAAEVFTRWAHDRRYSDARGRLIALPLRGEGNGTRTFEGLVRSVSKDFHPRSVLNELVRLGVVEVVGDHVRPQARAFVPQERFKDLAHYFGANLRDHVAAAAENLRATSEPDKAPYLEHAVIADELSPESIAKLEKLARNLWAGSVRKMFKAALAAVESDRVRPDEQRAMRMRFGAYYYSEPGAEIERASKRTRKGSSK